MDDNPGITDTNPYVYASKRKYNGGDTGKWEPFRDATLWTGMDPTLKKACVLSVGNDNEPVGIDSENNHVRDGYKSISFDTGWLELRDLEGNLKRIDTLYLNNIEFFNVTNGVNGQVTKVNNASVSIKVDNGTLTVTPSWGYVSDHLYYSCILKLTFTPNNGNNFITFSNRVSLNLTAKNSDGYYGSATLTLTPETSKYIVKELLENVALVRKSNKDATDYNPSLLSSAVYINGNKGLDTMKNIVVGVQFDDDPQHTIDVALGYYVNLATGGDNTRFKYRPVNANGDGHGNALTYSTEGNDISFYFDENGNRLSNQNNAVLEVRFYNSCKHKDHDEYSCYFNVYLNNLNYVITDNLRSRVGYNSEANSWSNNYENYITDESYIAVVYPGKDGLKGDKGDDGQDAFFLTAVYDEGSGNWATWFDNIRNGVSGYSWIPGELGQKWTVYIGTNILTDTPVTLEQPTMTPALKYLWKTSRAVTYNGNTPSYGTWSVPVLASQTGPKGEDGKTVVTYQYLNGKVIRMSNWIDNQLEYSNGETAVDGVYYLDVVKYISGSTTSYYKCISDVTYTSSNKPANPTDSTHWEVFTPQSDAWFETMLANSAYIENLTSKQVVITDNNNIVAGMTSGTITGTELENEVTPGNVRIWAGSTTNGDLTTAPFTVNNTGAVKASNINLAGGSITGTLEIGQSGKIRTDAQYGATHATLLLDADHINISTTSSEHGSSNRWTNIEESLITVHNDRIYTGLNVNDTMSISSSSIIYEDENENQYSAVFSSNYNRIAVLSSLPANPDPNTIYFITS